MRLNALAQSGDVPQSVLPEAQVFSGQVASGICRDPLMERLVRALLPADEAGVVLRGFYTDALHAALLKRLADLRGDTDPDPGGRRSVKLPAWRLKRVSEYVETNLGSPLSLAGLAKAAGLSSMYFAAQFRLATGMRPHDYVVRRRIQRAKAMLSDAGTPIVDVALSVGFQSQSHFTTVFKRIVGFTPQRWRAVRDVEADTASSWRRPQSLGNEAANQQN
jgi:AraC-like DNA-binding protein